MSVRFSIICPTIGRPQLRRLLESLGPAGACMDDELVLIVDGEYPEAHVMASEAALPCKLQTVTINPPGGCVGQPARNVGVAIAQGTHLVFTQDDNVLLADVLSNMRGLVDAEPDRPHIWRVMPRAGFVVPTVKTITEGCIDGDCFVVPNVPGRLGRWGMRYNGDFDWITSTLAHYPDGAVFHDDLIAANQDYSPA